MQERDVVKCFVGVKEDLDLNFKAAEVCGMVCSCVVSTACIRQGPAPLEAFWLGGGGAGGVAKKLSRLEARVGFRC